MASLDLWDNQVQVVQLVRQVVLVPKVLLVYLDLNPEILDQQVNLVYQDLKEIRASKDHQDQVDLQDQMVLWGQMVLQAPVATLDLQVFREILV